MRNLITSDWQVQLNTLIQCKKVHAQELEIIKDYKIDGHIDLGDLKQEYSPVDVRVVEFQFERTNNLFKVVDPNNTIKLMGNHDRIGQYSDDKNWFSLFRYLGGHVVTEKDIISYKEVTFFCLPFSRSIKQQKVWADELSKTVDNQEDGRKVLLFHQDIHGVKYSKITSGKSKASLSSDDLHFDSYDKCFGGHIHLRQKITKNGWYVGNPYACDWGEANQTKGFIIYDTESDRVTFVPCTVQTFFTYKHLKEHKEIEVTTGARIKDTVLCSVQEDYVEKINKRADLIKKKYPKADVQVVPKFEVADQTVVIEEGTSDVEKLKLFVDSTISGDLVNTKDIVMSYLAWVLQATAGYSLRSTDKIWFEKVCGVNALSFKDVEFDFRDKGIVLVVGKNKDWENHSNGAGKSNFLSLPCVAMFGRTFKGQKNNQWMNWRTKGPSSVDLTFKTTSVKSFRILRQRRPVKLKIWVNGKDTSTGLRHIQSQQIIENTTGYTLDTLANSVYVDQTLTNAFLTGTDMQRAELIYRFQNLDRFQLAKKYVLHDIGTLKAQQEDIDFEIQATQLVISERRDSIKRWDDSVAGTMAKYDELIKVKVKELSLLVGKTVSVIASLIKKKDVVAINLEKVEKKKAICDRKVGEAANARNMAEREIVRLKLVAKKTTCSVCHQPIDEHRLALLRTEAAKEFRFAHAKVLKFRKIYRLYNARCEHLYHRRDSYITRIDKIHSAIAELKDEIESLRKAKANAMAVETASKDLAKLNASIRKAKDKLLSCKDHKKDLVVKEIMLKYALSVFSKEGLPAFLNKLVCPLLNRAAEYYSELFLDKEIQVVFEIEKDYIVPRIINVHGDREIVGQSTGEKAWAGLIASLSLRELTQPTNLLILDEPGHGLDAESAKTFGERLKRLKDKFETILVTTHNPAIQSALSSAQVLVVEKRKGISKLRGE